VKEFPCMGSMEVVPWRVWHTGVRWGCLWIGSPVGGPPGSPVVDPMEGVLWCCPKCGSPGVVRKRLSPRGCRETGSRERILIRVSPGGGQLEVAPCGGTPGGIPVEWVTWRSRYDGIQGTGLREGVPWMGPLESVILRVSHGGVPLNGVRCSRLEGSPGLGPLEGVPLRESF
jgi:hypothetical protein